MASELDPGNADHESNSCFFAMEFQVVNWSATICMVMVVLVGGI